MGATPTTDNKIAGFFDQLIKAGIQGGEAALTAYIGTTPAAPLVTLPIVKNIVGYFLSLLGGAIYKNVAEYVAMAVLDVQTNLEKSAVGNAVTALKNAQASGDQDAINKAKSDFDSAAASLIHWDGSAPAA